MTFSVSARWMSLFPEMVQSSVMLFCLILVNGGPDTCQASCARAFQYV